MCPCTHTKCLLKCDQMTFTFQHSPSCSPHTSSIGMCLGPIDQNRMNFSAHTRVCMCVYMYIYIYMFQPNIFNFKFAFYLVKKMETHLQIHFEPADSCSPTLRSLVSY